MIIPQGSNAVWIQELFVDAFEGPDDLALHQLVASLNIIRVPTQREANRLRRFIPSVLFGAEEFASELPASAWAAETRGGSMIVAESCGPDRVRQWDLCRLTLDDAGSLSELQILEDAANDQDVEAFLGKLDQIGSEAYLATFTDLLAPRRRLQIWRQTPRVRRLLWPSRKQQVRLEKREEKHATRVSRKKSATGRDKSSRRQAQPEPTERPPKIDPYAGRRRVLARAERDAAKRLEAVVSTERSRRDHKEQAAEQDAEQAAKLIMQARTRYLETQASIRELRESIQHLRGQIEPLELQQQSVSDAERFAPKWQALLQLSAQIRPDSSDRAERSAGQAPDAATPESLASDARAIERLDQELDELRSRLQSIKQTAASDPDAERGMADQRAVLQTISELLEQAEEYREAWEALAATSAILRHPDLAAADAVSSPDHAVREAVRQELIEAAAVRESTRRRAKLSGTEDMPESLDAPTAVDPKGRTRPPSPGGGEESLDKLRLEIRQAREETRLLLGRQLLSPHALLAIGVLFSAGVAICMAAVFLRPRGAELPTGIFGIALMVAAALLKASFERAPTDRLRRQRMRLEALMAELQSGYARGSRLQTNKNPVVPDRKSWTDKVVQADLAWRETLARHDLPVLLDLDDALAELELRWQREQPIAQPLRLALHHHHPSIDRAAMSGRVRRWEQQAARCLAAQSFTAQSFTAQSLEDRDRREGREASSDSDAAESVTDHWQPSDWILALREHAANVRRHFATCDDQHKQAEAALVELQQQMKKLKHRRRKILERNGVEDLDALQQAIVRRSELDQSRIRREQLLAEWEQIMARHPRGAQIRDLLENERPLTSLRQHLEQELASVKQRLSQMQTELQEKKALIEQLSSRLDARLPDDTGQPEIAYRSPATWMWFSALLARMQKDLPPAFAAEQEAATLSSETPVLETQALGTQQTEFDRATEGDGEKDADVDADADADEAHHVTPTAARATRPRVLRLADKILAQMTGIRNRSIRWREDAELPELIVRGAASIENVPWTALPAGDRQAMVLALQFALMDRLAGPSLSFPAIFGDTTFRQRAAEHDEADDEAASISGYRDAATSDPPDDSFRRTLRARLARAFRQLASRGHQVIVVLHDRSWIETFQELDVATLSVTRHRVESSKPSVRAATRDPLLPVAEPIRREPMASSLTTDAPDLPEFPEASRRPIEVGWERAAVTPFPNDPPRGRSR